MYWPIYFKGHFFSPSDLYRIGSLSYLLLPYLSLFFVVSILPLTLVADLLPITFKRKKGLQNLHDFIDAHKNEWFGSKAHLHNVQQKPFQSTNSLNTTTKDVNTTL